MLPLALTLGQFRTSWSRVALHVRAISDCTAFHGASLPICSSSRPPHDTAQARGVRGLRFPGSHRRCCVSGRCVCGRHRNVCTDLAKQLLTVVAHGRSVKLDFEVLGT